MSLEGRAVVIVGMCRSGTSSVAGALARLGVFFGKPEHLYAEDSHNEGGYWEHRMVNAAIRKFHLSLNLPNLDVESMPDDWMERPMSEFMVASALKTFETHFSGRALWGWKDPQASSLLPFVKGVFGRTQVPVHLVICVRNPLDVASSQAKRQGTPIDQTLGGWLLSTLSALKDSHGMSRSIVIYEQFLENPRTSLTRVVESLGMNPSSEEWEATDEWVRPALSHGEDNVANLLSQPQILKSSYELCLKAARSPELLETEDFAEEVERLWSEWSTWHHFTTRSNLAEAKFGLSWERSGSRQVQETRCQPTRSWQTLSGSTRALPGSRVSVHLYPLPAIVWIRKAFWKQAETEVPAKLIQGMHGQLDDYNGIQRVWLFGGYDQVAVEAPIAQGQFELELEVLVESSNLIFGMTFQELSKRTLPS